MKDWKNLVADVQKPMNKHFTKGRNGKKIDKVLIHHNDGFLSIDDIWRVWQTRRASAHYQVEQGGRIGQLVWDSDMGWHAGNLEANETAIGIEHANKTRYPHTVTEATLDNGAHLTAAICIKYGLGRPEWGKNVFGHQEFASTACPGSLGRKGNQHDRFVERMNYWYDQMTQGGKNTNPPKPAKEVHEGKSVDQLANEVIAGKWGSGETRRHRLEKAGYSYSEVQARVNQIVSSRKPAKKSVNTIVNEVIQGKWGNGADRKKRLQAAGYNAQDIQNRVNRRLLG